MTWQSSYHSVYSIGGWGWSILWGFNSLQDLHLDPPLLFKAPLFVCFIFFEIHRQRSRSSALRCHNWMKRSNFPTCSHSKLIRCRGLVWPYTSDVSFPAAYIGWNSHLNSSICFSFRISSYTDKKDSLHSNITILNISANNCKPVLRKDQYSTSFLMASWWRFFLQV